MDRLTREVDGKDFYIVDDIKVQNYEGGYSGDAIIKLAKFENVYDDLVAKQNKIAEELEQLRFEGKTHSVKFKQLLANKMTNSNILILFKSYGL